MMIMTQTHTRAIESTTTPLEALFPREQRGVVQPNGTEKPVFLGHPSARCDICEAAFSAELQHPRSEDHEGLIVVCGGHLMRLTRAIA